MTFKSILVPLFILMSATFAESQNLSLQQCLEQAQQHSPLLKADEAQVSALQKEAALQGTLQWPQISGELAAEQRFLKPYQFNQSWALVHADWSFGDFLFKTSQAAEQEALAAQLAAEARRLQVSRETAQLYLRLLLADKQAAILQQRFELLQSHHDLAEALWRSGVRSQLDVLQTESDMTLMQEELAQNELIRENLLRELRLRLGLEVDAELSLLPLASEKIVQAAPPDFSTEQLEAVPALQVFDARMTAQSLRKKMVQAQQWPSLHAAGGAMADGDPTGDGNYWQANVGLQMPLYRWGATRLQKEKVEANLSSLEWQRKDIERELIITAQNNVAELANLKTIIAVQSQRLAINEKAFEFAQANYKAGLVTNLEYLTAQQQLAESQINLQTARLRYVLALVEFYLLTNQIEKVGHLE